MGWKGIECFIHVTMHWRRIPKSLILIYIILCQKPSVLCMIWDKWLLVMIVPRIMDVAIWMLIHWSISVEIASVDGILDLWARLRWMVANLNLILHLLVTHLNLDVLFQPLHFISDPLWSVLLNYLLNAVLDILRKIVKVLFILQLLLVN